MQQLLLSTHHLRQEKQRPLILPWPMYVYYQLIKIDIAKLHPRLNWNIIRTQPTLLISFQQPRMIILRQMLK